MSPIEFHALSAYDYMLPEALIAQSPAVPRDSSRLLVVDRAKGSWAHRRFTDLPEYFGAADVLVANNTRVIKARLLGRRLKQEPDGRWVPGGGVEFVMLEPHGPRTWEGLFKASAKYVPGLRFEIPTPDGQGLRGTLIRGSQDSPHGTVVAEFDRDPLECDAGELPLPHYIKRDGTTGGAGVAAAAGPTPAAGTSSDAESYQTHYAKHPGSAAAPTAGLHFTPAVLEALRARGASWEEITLNVGLGTFRPVKTEDIRGHAMHDERYDIPAAAAARITAAKRAGQRITAIGTTSVRTLESAWREAGASAGGGASATSGGELPAGPGRTAIFIHPAADFRFRVVDRLLTNFHLPKSTLLMLVCTFAGRELTLAAYEEAVREKYRFFSYGDAMLIL